MSLSSALVYSTRLRVSVCGTGSPTISGSGFSRQSDYVHYRVIPRESAYSQVRFMRWICLPQSTSTPFNLLFRQQAALSLLRLHVPHWGSTGNIGRTGQITGSRTKDRQCDSECSVQQSSYGSRYSCIPSKPSHRIGTEELYHTSSRRKTVDETYSGRNRT